MNDNAQIIKEFIEAWSMLDAEKLAGYFAEDGCYYNMPLEPVTGRENVREFIGGFVTAWTKTDWEIINLVESGNNVIAERLDKTKSAQGDVDLPCVGVFEMEGGKIKVWRDYFDMSTYINAMAS